MNATTLNIVQGTIQDVRYMLEPVPANNGETYTKRFTKFIDKMSLSSYKAWEKSGKIESL